MLSSGQPSLSNADDMLINHLIETALTQLPAEILERSGAVFYSGREAFSGSKSLYVLGLNPGGNAEEQRQNTVATHLAKHSKRKTAWSEYTDERWEGREPGTYGIQPQLLQLFQKLNLDARYTPASNVVFVRTRNELSLKSEKTRLLDLCWPVHHAVIKALKVKVVLCLGKTAGSWACSKLNANNPVGRFVETNKRGWATNAYCTEGGLVVISATHPARADWRNPAADPASLIKLFL